jgi:DNA-binding transcriptional LysR family regulator
MQAYVKSIFFWVAIRMTDTSRIDLNLLATFEVLLAERNVTKAAARLHLSQPAVSGQLHRLRALFGDPLLIPARRGMTPTAKALELFTQLRPVLDDLRATLTHHQTFDPETAELTVSIACSDYTQSVLVIPLVLALRKAAPGIRVAVRTLDPAAVVGQMTRGEVDLAFTTPELAPPSLRFRHLYSERYVLIARWDHPELEQALTVESFAALEHVVVSPSGGCFMTPVDEALAVRGLQRHVALSAASFLFVPQIVSRSDFVALVPERLVRDCAGNLKRIEPPLPVRGFDMLMVWHERSHGHAGQRWIRELIVALAGAPTERSGGGSFLPSGVGTVEKGKDRAREPLE